MKSSKKTKIVCTIGPSSWDPQIMGRMIQAGMNCARVNGAFADEAELDKVTRLVREHTDEVTLMMDVKGPEVRMNKFAEAIAIKPGDLLEIGSNESFHVYPANYPDLYKYIEQDQRIVVGDGDVELVVRRVVDGKMICEVVFGELLKPGKALNLPGAQITSSALTEKDIRNLKHSLEIGWDFVSASFIQNAKSAREIREYLKGSNMQLIAKIEDQMGVDNIDDILREVDGIMIARGGLGVELGLEKVPGVQRYLIERVNEVGKPIITATQMLESMTYSPRPTRAEANDVATAIMLGSDAVMLSGESSAGKYPVESVEWLSKIAQNAERFVEPKVYENDEYLHDFYQTSQRDNIQAGNAMTITKSAASACQNLDIKAVFVLSKEGFTANMLSRHRINQKIYTYVPSKAISRKLNLTYGVESFTLDQVIATDRDELIKEILSDALSKGIITQGDLVAVVVGTFSFTNRNSSILEIIRV